MNPNIIAFASGWTLAGHPIVPIEVDPTNEDPAGTFIVIAGNRVKRVSNEQDQDVRYNGEPLSADSASALQSAGGRGALTELRSDRSVTHL
jgi:hypothetical protein